MSQVQPKVQPLTKLVPHVCMTCGDAKGVVPGWGVPYCLNHGIPGTPMTPAPLEKIQDMFNGTP